MKKPILFFAAALLGFTSFSQNYQPATVVTSDGNTLTGQVNYKNWKQNPSKIQFRKDEASSAVTYNDHDLKSVTVADDRYILGIVDVDYRSENPKYITNESNIITRHDTVLLRVLVSGTKSLYYYYDNVDHFYISNNDTFELLRYKRYISGRESQDRLYMYNRDFLVQLEQYFQGCQSFSSLSRTRYQTNDLKRAFSKYYSCSSGAPEFVQKDEKEKVDIGVIAGASNTTFKVAGSGFGPNGIMSRTDFSSSVNFAGGVYFDVVFPRQRGKLSLNNELMYSAYETSGTYRESTSPTRYYDQTFDFSFTYVKMNNMIRYRFLMNNAAIFVNGGISNGVLVSETSTFTRFRKIDDYETTSVDNTLRDPRKYELGFLAGVGFKLSRISLELRAEKGSGPLMDDDAAAHVYRYFALLGFRIK